MLNVAVEGVAVADAFQREPRRERDDFGKSACEPPNRSFMSAARNEPSASAASWDNAIMDRSRRKS